MINKSFAKINLGLKVLNQRSDGYHNISSIFIQIDLHDTLHFIPNNKFELISKGIAVPIDNSNTVYKIVEFLSKKFNIEIKHKIIIDKSIPLGSGLGGGSSNAAIAITTLANLYNLKISKQDFIIYTKNIGSDIPFFLEGGIKHITGKGEIINSINTAVFKNKKILLVFPKFNISTKWAYSQVKKHLDSINNQTKFSPLAEIVNWKLFNNDFENIVSRTYPEILKIKDILYKGGALYSGLSGSGSTMFGLYNDTVSLDKVQSLLSEYQTNIAFPII